jgi:hypothetical protein
MMNSATYTLTGDNAAFNGTPDKIVIAYAGKVTTNSFLGNDNNTNVVTVTYVGDTAGNLDKAKAEVKAWTYGANIVKTDGSTGDYLAGALFDLYRLDTTIAEALQLQPSRQPLIIQRILSTRMQKME